MQSVFTATEMRKNQKIHDAMAKIVEAIQHLSDAMPRTGGDQQKLNDTLRALNEARELLANGERANCIS